MKQKTKIFFIILTIILFILVPITSIEIYKYFNEENIANYQYDIDDKSLAANSHISDNENNQISSTPIPTPEILNYRKGLFSWVPNTINENERSILFKVIDTLEIDEVYQYFEIYDAKNEDAKIFAQQLDTNNVDLYILAGEADWTYTPDGIPMLEEIQRATLFRSEWGDNMIKGIVFDIEPYASKKWANNKQEILLENYVSGMKEAYAAAQEQDLRIILCIPTWFDVYHQDTLVELIKYCDEISVMNYDRTNEYDNISDEIALAKKNNKSITCIFEFQAVGQYNLTDEQTYYNYGVDAAESNFEEIYRKADYSELKFAYHYLEALKELLEY